MALTKPRVVRVRKIEDVDRSLANVVNSLSRVYGSDIVDGVRTDEIDVEVGDNIIEHTLGRQPVGWFVIDTVGAAPALYRKRWDSRTMTLNSDVAATLSLWVF